MNEDIRDLFAEVKLVNAEAERIYDALRATRQLGDQRLLSYRCRMRRCLLLDFVQVPGAVIVHSPAYRLSPELNEASSSQAARVKNTSDGDRRWKAHTYDARSALNFVVNCDHVQGVVLDRADVQADLNQGHAEILVAPDGERCAS